MSSSSDDTILPPQRRSINSSGLDGDTVLPSQNAPGIHIPGDVIDSRYTVIREIGRGGMGVVYEVEDAVTSDRYAVKRLLPEYSSRSEIVEVFRSEGAASMRFTNKSPRFVTTQTVNLENDIPYIVLQLVKQPTLRTILQSTTGGRLLLPEALPILRDIAIALSELHDLGYVHRDLKPENIFIDFSDGNPTVMLVDFGLTKDIDYATRTMMRGAGTERYASPEQLKGMPTTPATDVYAFGVIAYEVLSREMPAYGDNISNYVEGIPQVVLDLINSCLSVQPERRPKNGNALVIAFTQSKVVSTSNPVKLINDQSGSWSTLQNTRSSLQRTTGPSKYPELTKYIESMCQIPSGSFQMSIISGDTDEKSFHRLSVSSFYMGATPVTVAMWKEYCEATGRVMPKVPFWGWIDDHPIVNISWSEIMGVDRNSGYCGWARTFAGVPLTLPTDSQFEYASRSGQSGLQYPWGDVFDDSKLWCSREAPRTKTAPVVRRTNIYRNQYGLTDIAGNVWQLCNEDDDPFGLTSQNVSVLTSSLANVLLSARGGPWNGIISSYFRCDYRYRFLPTDWNFDLGFRLAAECR